jgi:hypothetical protein
LPPLQLTGPQRAGKLTQPRELGLHHCQQVVQCHQIRIWRDTGVAKRHDFGGPGLQRPDAVIDRVRRGVAIQGIDLGKCDDELRELMDRSCDQLAHPLSKRLGTGVGDLIDGALRPLPISSRAARRTSFSSVNRSTT